MAKNDLVLLDSLIESAKGTLGTRDDSESFELFCFDQILKDFDPSHEDLEAGWVDGGDDGGVDGFYVVLDDIVLADPPSRSARRNPNLDLYVVTSKRSPSFKQAPLNALLSSLPELLDLTKTREDLKYPFCEELLEQRDLFRETYVRLADKHPRLRIRVFYACRGDTVDLNPNIGARADLIRDELLALFSDSDIAVDCLGARELLELARKQRSYSLRLRFIEAAISRERTNYVLLCLLRDYLDFVTDEDGKLRRYLFDSNVRDFLGELAINRDIAATLASGESRAEVDFWWLNNGITLLASAATVAGKELSLENVQIVNGLQTTETIYRYFDREAIADEDRAVLLKVIVTSDETIRDRIVKATNYQNMVDLASLRGTDKVQRDIEHFLGDHGWYYDRRKGFYKNQGRPEEKIVSVSYLGSAVQAIALRNYSVGFRGRTKWLRNDATYDQVFDEERDLNVFLSCVELGRSIEENLRKAGVGRGGRYGRRAAAFAIASVWVARQLGKADYRPNDIAELAHSVPSAREILDIWGNLGGLTSRNARHVKGLAERVRRLCTQITSEENGKDAAV